MVAPKGLMWTLGQIPRKTTLNVHQKAVAFRILARCDVGKRMTVRRPAHRKSVLFLKIVGEKPRGLISDAEQNEFVNGLLCRCLASLISCVGQIFSIG